MWLAKLDDDDDDDDDGTKEREKIVLPRYAHGTEDWLSFM